MTLSRLWYHVVEDWPLALPPAIVLYAIAEHYWTGWRLRRRFEMDAWQRRMLIDGQDRRGFDVLTSPSSPSDSSRNAGER